MHSVVLIGMPGAGKSTVGVLLAKRLGLGFIDTDILIQQRAGRQLQEILDAAGYRELRRLEEEAILALEARGAVIATGGSAVYSERAMRHLGEGGVLVYLKASRDVLTARIDDYGRRGIANSADQSFEEICRERMPLYERWADVVVAVDGLTHEGVARAVVAAVRNARPGESPRHGAGAPPGFDRENCYNKKP
jgi:shikimate kinase